MGLLDGGRGFTATVHKNERFEGRNQAFNTRGGPNLDMDIVCYDPLGIARYDGAFEIYPLDFGFLTRHQQHRESVGIIRSFLL